MSGKVSRIVKGADLKIYINNKLFGLVLNFTWQAGNGRRPIYGIDNPEPQEIADGQNFVSGTIAVVRLRDDAGLEGYGVVAQPHETTREKYTTITVVDRVTDRPIFTCDKARIKSQSWNVTARDMLTGSFQFDGIVWENEFGSGA